MKKSLNICLLGKSEVSGWIEARRRDVSYFARGSSISQGLISLASFLEKEALTFASPKKGGVWLD